MNNAGFLAAALYFALPAALTVAIEAAVGFMFALKKEEQRFLLLVNIATNLSLNLLLYLYRLYIPFSDIYALVALEAAIVLVEWKLMQAYSRQRRNCFLISLCCNAASLSIGTLLIALIQS